VSFSKKSHEWIRKCFNRIFSTIMFVISMHQFYHLFLFYVSKQQSYRKCTSSYRNRTINTVLNTGVCEEETVSTNARDRRANYVVARWRFWHNFFSTGCTFTLRQSFNSIALCFQRRERAETLVKCNNNKHIPPYL